MTLNRHDLAGAAAELECDAKALRYLGGLPQSKSDESTGRAHLKRLVEEAMAPGLLRIETRVGNFLKAVAVARQKVAAQRR